MTNLFTDDDTGSASCLSFLGDECTSAILEDSATVSGETCFSSGNSWRFLPKCASSFGAGVLQVPKYGSGVDEGTLAMNARPLDPTDFINLQQSRAVAERYAFSGSSMSGAGFYSSASDAYNGSDTAPYDFATNRLQIMVVSFPADEEGGSKRESQAMCMRVSTSRLSSNGTPAASQAPRPTGTASMNMDLRNGLMVWLMSVAFIFHIL